MNPAICRPRFLAGNNQEARSSLQNWRELEEACEKGWLLTTRQELQKVYEAHHSQP